VRELDADDKADAVVRPAPETFKVPLGTSGSQARPQKKDGWARETVEIVLAESTG